ncbi:MAG: protein-glutamate O-methyltransferase [Gammaproteobacteria bacterium]|nr:protein-glutamate O-methyltransferase [Gammaproteobacteria bacterium]
MVDEIHEREFDFTNADFEKIRSFVKEETGIKLSDGKKNMVYGRLSRRLRQVGISRFSDYFDMVSSNESSDERGQFINAITTNLTSFFREEHHFDFLKNDVVPRLMKENASTRKIRIWSAGCSTGEEPYSIAIALYESIPDIEKWDIRILATDLDTNVLAHGQRGIYDIERISALSKTRKATWFLKGKGGNSGSVKVDSRLQSLITFRQLNLMGAWPMKGPFDFMFCRNVVIYFDKDTQKILFDRYANLLSSSANLFLGHSESMHNVCDRFNLIGNTIYNKKY